MRLAIAAEEERLLLNPPLPHIGPAAKQCWEERGQKLDRYVRTEEAAASIQEIQLAHALDENATTVARSQVEELDTQIAAMEAAQRRDDEAAREAQAAERREAENRRRSKLEEREGAVLATSKGGQWLDEAHQTVLAGADRELTLVEREQSVETVEGRLEAEFSRRESELPAREEEEFSDRDAPPSFAERERFLEWVEQFVDEVLRAEEEALRSFQLGKEHLLEAEPNRAAGARPTLAERESIVLAVEQQVGEELDRRQERLIARAGNDTLLFDAIEELGIVSADGPGLADRAKIAERAEGMLKVALAELDRQEASLRDDPVGGAECLRRARREVVGAGRKAETLVEREEIFERASDMAAERAATLATATAAAQAAAARSKVELHDDNVRAIYKTGRTHAAGIAVVERTTEALDAAADQRLPAKTIIDTLKANLSDPGGIPAALADATAAARKEQERKAAAKLRAAALKEQSAPAQPTLEQRYRERFPDNAADVDRPEWSLAKKLQREDQAIRDRTPYGRRTDLEYEYMDCFQRRGNGSFAVAVKELRALPHCLRDTDEPPPDNEQDPLRAIDQYAESLPDAYRGAWSELDIAGRARAAIDKLWVTSPKRDTNAVRDECGADARTFDETMRKDRESRALVLGIVHRTHEVRYWEKQQEEWAKDRHKTETRTEDRNHGRGRNSGGGREV